MNNEIYELDTSLFNETQLPSELRFRFTLNRLLQIYKAARISTLVLGCEKQRIKSRTLKQYKKIIINLKRKDPETFNPFYGFQNILNASPSYTNNTLSTYKVALRSFSCRLILKLIPSILLEISKNHSKDALRMYFSQHSYYGVSEDLLFTSQDLKELTNSVDFLIKYPPLMSPRTHIENTGSPKSLKRRKKASKFHDFAYFEKYLEKSGSSLTFFEYCWHYYQNLKGYDRLRLSKKLIMATLMSTGCRPSELHIGILGIVCINRISGKPCLAFMISGKKLSRAPIFPHEILDEKEKELEKKLNSTPSMRDYLDRGQSHRYIVHETVGPIQSWLINFIKSRKNNGTILPRQLRTKLNLHNFDPTHIRLLKIENSYQAHSTHPNALNKTCVREGRKIFPEANKNLTPYVMRHAFKTALENQDTACSELISAALGHQSDKSQSHYGRRNASASKLKFSNVKAWSVEPIRFKAKYWDANFKDKGIQDNRNGRKL